LAGVLDSVTKSKEMPNAGFQRLKFYIRDDAAPEGVTMVPFTLKTTGGDCRNLVARQLSQLFKDVGIAPDFRWEKAGPARCCSPSHRMPFDSRKK